MRKINILWYHSLFKNNAGSGSTFPLKSPLQCPSGKLFMRVKGRHRVQTSSLHCKKEERDLQQGWIQMNSNQSSALNLAFKCLVSSLWTHHGDICFNRQTTRAVSCDQQVPKWAPPSGGSGQSWHLNKVLLQSEMKNIWLLLKHR